MKLAVVGAGAWGKNLVRTLNALDSLGAVVEVNSTLREAVKEQYPGVDIYEDLDMLLNSDIPAAMIAVPAELHFAVAKQLLEAGKDVFVEKPVTLCSTEAQQLVDIATEQGRVLMVGHLLIYQSAVRWIKSAIEEKMIGQLRSIHQTRCGLGRARDVENVLWSLGVHDVAVAQYLVGSSPVACSVSGQRIVQPGVEDDIYLHTQFPNNIMVHLHCSWLWPEKQRGMTIVGTEGMLVYNELEQTVTLHKKSIGLDLKNVDEGSEQVFQGSGQPLTAEVEHFIECVQNRSQPVSDGVSGVQVVKILEQAMEGLTS